MLKIQVECKTSSVNSLVHFLYIILELQHKQVHHWEEHGISVQKQHGHFPFSFYLYAISTLEGDGDTYKPVCIHSCLAYKQKQAITYIICTCILVLNIIFTIPEPVRVSSKEEEGKVRKEFHRKPQFFSHHLIQIQQLRKFRVVKTKTTVCTYYYYYVRYSLQYTSWGHPVNINIYKTVWTYQLHPPSLNSSKRKKYYNPNSQNVISESNFRMVDFVLSL